MSQREELHELEVFGRWVDDGMPSPPPQELLDANYVTRSEEAMPDQLCESLKLPHGASYARSAKVS